VLYGSNISLIAGVMTALFGRIFGKRRAFFVVVAGILLYTLLVGADGSVTRAAILGHPWKMTLNLWQSLRPL
jgi:predicted membrane metal-binding protein